MYFRFDHHHQSFSSISFLPSLLRVFETLKSIINHHFFAFPRSNCYFRKYWKIGVAFYNVLQTRETIHRILSIAAISPDRIDKSWSRLAIHQIHRS